MLLRKGWTLAVAGLAATSVASAQDAETAPPLITETAEIVVVGEDGEDVVVVGEANGEVAVIEATPNEDQVIVLTDDGGNTVKAQNVVIRVQSDETDEGDGRVNLTQTFEGKIVIVGPDGKKREFTFDADGNGLPEGIQVLEQLDLGLDEPHSVQQLIEMVGGDEEFAVEMDADGEPPFVIGVRCSEPDELLASHLQLKGGVLVDEIAEESPAAAAGIEPGDIIVAVGDIHIDSLEKLANTIRSSEGKEVLIGLIHAGEKKSVKATPKQMEPAAYAELIGDWSEEEEVAVQDLEQMLTPEFEWHPSLGEAPAAVMKRFLVRPSQGNVRLRSFGPGMVLEGKEIDPEDMEEFVEKAREQAEKARAEAMEHARAAQQQARRMQIRVLEEKEAASAEKDQSAAGMKKLQAQLKQMQKQLEMMQKQLNEAKSSDGE